MTYQYHSRPIVVYYKLKKTEAAKRVLKTNVNTGKCDNTGNVNETVIHAP